jgi:hypothetical protein
MSNSPELFKLSADANFPAATVSIIDGHYGIVAEGLGKVAASVPSGLYIVQFKADKLFEKQPVDVSADTFVEAKTFSSPASLRLLGSCRGQLLAFSADERGWKSRLLGRYGRTDCSATTAAGQPALIN